MRIVEVTERPLALIDRLVDVWERSVKVTHLFLSDSEIAEIKKYVPQALGGVPHLMIAKDEDQVPVAFMGVDRQKLEVLFLAPEERGKGLGKQLIQHGVEQYAINEVTVNEQNPQAIGFYERMGFRTFKRTELDEQGNPYPLLYMRLEEIKI